MGEAAQDVLHGVVHLDDSDGRRRTHRLRRLGYAVTTAVLSAVMAVAVLDGLGVVGAVGVDDAEVAASADGTTLSVRYPTVSRPALASPFVITITRAGGFGEQQVEVTVSTDYMALWDENGILPGPAEETAAAEDLHWTFDPPDGEVLRITYDGRIEPGAQSGGPGRVAVLDDDGAVVVAVRFETQIRP